MTGGPNWSFNLPVQEMCREEFTREAYLDGVTGAAVAEATQLLSGPSSVVDDPETLGAMARPWSGRSSAHRSWCGSSSPR